ncbi:L-serine ammonia-lyase, partial [Bacillus sp. S34]|nr:L-serine ammonia-lyase [Bacillus sp. S34]
MRLRAAAASDLTIAEETYYSIGGGFITSDTCGDVAEAAIPVDDAVPHPFSSGAELLAACAATGLPVSGVALALEHRADEQPGHPEQR